MEQKSDFGGEIPHCGLMFYWSIVTRSSAFVLVRGTVTLWSHPKDEAFRRPPRLEELREVNLVQNKPPALEFLAQ